MSKRETDIVWCAAVLEACSCEKRLQTSEAFLDLTGYYWCIKHRNRGKLLNYGARHDWPSLSFGRFALGLPTHDPEMWKMPIIMGSDEMIEAALAHLGRADEDGGTTRERR